MDLGIILARKHYALLATTWLMVTLPCFIVLTLIFWDNPMLAIVILWWLKPLFERIPLHILASAVFNNIPTRTQTLVFWLKSFKRHVISNLLWQRLSFNRSFNLPVQQLEGATGKARRLRLRVLHRSPNNSSWLTLIFVNFEWIFYLSLLIICYKLMPSSPVDINTLEESFIDSSSLFNEHTSNIQLHLSNLAYVLILAITEPLYVSCGFCLYLNRRIHLEGWDIELAFRRLAKRLGQIATLILIGLCIVINPVAHKTAYADPNDSIESLDLAPLTGQKNNTQNTTSLQKREDAKKQIEQVVNNPPFYEEKEQTDYHWKSNNTRTQSNPNPIYFNSLDKAPSNQVSAILLWSIVILAAGALLYFAIRKIPRMNQDPNKKNKHDDIPTELFGLAITPDTLPKNIIDEFDSLWENQPRQALSLLYRALLSHLITEHRLSIKKSNTEIEIIALAKNLQHPVLTEFTRYLTHLWLLMAYGHYAPYAEDKDKLKEGWQALHNQEGTSK